MKLREERRASLASGVIERADANPSGLWNSSSPSSSVLAELGPVDGATAFGRIDLADETFHIGRLSIFDADKDPVVITWKSPVGGLFYSANVNEPGDVLRKRTFVLEDDPTGSYPTNALVDVTDENYATGEVDPAADAGDHLLRELARSRSGEMRDIVATIQSHQYALIAATAERPLLIQGGPGTGKTAVALHRVSWLLHDRRDRGWRPEDVLVIGPTKAFTRYVQRVLPSLGDQGVVQIDIGGLAPSGLVVDRSETPEVAALKGELRMAELLRRGVESRISVPEKIQEISWKTARVRFAPDALSDYVEAAQSAGYARGRERLAQRLLEDVNAARGLGTEPAERSVVARLVDKIWPRLSPAAVLRELLGSERRLLQAAGDSFTAAEVLRLHRKPADKVSEERFSTADAALLDELEFILGSDRVGRFKHVVVDEAQDLTPMQLRAIERRLTDRSITMLGDLAQSTGPVPLRDWDTVTSVFGAVEFAEMTAGYRIPAEVSDFAAALIPRVAHGFEGPTAIRETGHEPMLEEVEPDELVPSAATWAEGRLPEQGSAAVILPESLLDSEARELEQRNVAFRRVDDEPRDELSLLTPRQAKGLEFDHVCVVGPELIAAGGLGDLRALYVALTRPTTTLTVLHSGDPLAASIEIQGLEPESGQGAADDEDRGDDTANQSEEEAPALGRRLDSLIGHEWSAVVLVGLGRLVEFGSDEALRDDFGELAAVRTGLAALSSPSTGDASVVAQADALLDGRGPVSEVSLDALLVASCWAIGLMRSCDLLDATAQSEARAATGALLKLARERSAAPTALRTELERVLLG